MDNEKKTILNTAKLQAKELVKNANQKIEATIKDIREQGADKLATKEIRQELQDFQDGLKVQKLVAGKVVSGDTDNNRHTDNGGVEKDVIEVIAGEITIGSLVRIKGQEALGEVIGMRGKDAEVAIGELKTTVKLNRLEKISRKEFKQKTAPKSKFVGVDMNDKMMNFSFNLDLRGKRGDEALMEVDKFMNDALMLGQDELRIVHGKGDGILRTLIRNHLRGYKQVAKTQDEHADRGGAGVTLVSMR